MKERPLSSDTIGLLVKIVVASALLSLLIKYGGPLLPISMPYTERLNGLVTLIIAIPSLVMGALLVVLLTKSR